MESPGSGNEVLMETTRTRHWEEARCGEDAAVRERMGIIRKAKRKAGNVSCRPGSVRQKVGEVR